MVPLGEEVSRRVEVDPAVREAGSVEYLRAVDQVGAAVVLAGRVDQLAERLESPEDAPDAVRDDLGRVRRAHRVHLHLVRLVHVEAGVTLLAAPRVQNLYLTGAFQVL